MSIENPTNNSNSDLSPMEKIKELQHSIKIMEGFSDLGDGIEFGARYNMALEKLNKLTINNDTAVGYSEYVKRSLKELESLVAQINNLNKENGDKDTLTPVIQGKLNEINEVIDNILKI